MPYGNIPEKSKKIMKEKKHILNIAKELHEESKITDHVAYYPMAGASVVSDYQAPDAFVLLFFETASGIHYIDLKPYEEGNCQIHISFPGQLHSWNTKGDCRGHKLILSKYLVEKYLYNTGFPESIMNRFPIIKPGAENFSKVLNEVTLLARDLSAPDVEWLGVILRMRLIATFVGKWIQEARPPELKKYYLKRFFELLQENFRTHKSVAFYAGKLSISASYLNAICKQELSINIKTIINDKIASEAKRLLLEENSSIKEISYYLGFRDLANFSRFMKTRVGFSPQELRRAFTTS